jgi:CBS domain containing-hemolysin-like protein
MMQAAALFCFALAMNAFSSGAETGYYRMTRLRLVLEAMTGDRIARIMLWLANQPSLVVATTLVGNNLANELTSKSLAMATDRLFPRGGTLIDFLLPLAVTPFMFICGDLLPKNLFFNAPNRLMRRSAPLLVASAVVFAPITILLWLIGQILKVFVREAPQDLRLSLARRELTEMLTEGHEAGILRPVQRTLAQTMLAIAGQPVRNFAAPAGRVGRVTTTMSKSEILRMAQGQRRTLLPIEDLHDKRRLVGYIRTADLFLDNAPELPPPRPMIELSESESFLSALTKLTAADDALGHVTSAAGKTIGFVSAQELQTALFRPQ